MPAAKTANAMKQNPRSVAQGIGSRAIGQQRAGAENGIEREQCSHGGAGCAVFAGQEHGVEEGQGQDDDTATEPENTESDGLGDGIRLLNQPGGRRDEADGQQRKNGGFQHADGDLYADDVRAADGKGQGETRGAARAFATQSPGPQEGKDQNEVDALRGAGIDELVDVLSVGRASEVGETRREAQALLKENRAQADPCEDRRADQEARASLTPGLVPEHHGFRNRAASSAVRRSRSGRRQSARWRRETTRAVALPVVTSRAGSRASRSRS